MTFRLLLQPPWLRFLVYALLTGVLFGAGNSFESRSIWGFVISGLFFGVLFAVFLVYQTQDVHKAVTEAVAGLTNAERSQAIEAVMHGVVPPDSRLRSAATRLGRAYLRDKSAGQLKRQERMTWIALVLLVAADIAAVVLNSTEHHGLYFVALGLLAVIALPLGILRSRRIQRNVALLAEGPVFR